MRAAHLRAVRLRSGPGAPAQVRSSPASASSDRRCPSQYLPRARAMFADTPALPFNRRDSVPRSHPRRAAVSVTFQPASSMLSRMSSPRCGGFCIGPTRSLAMSFMVSTPLRSVIVDQVHVHGLAVLKAKNHAPVSGDADVPLTCPVASERMHPEARRVGASRMRCLLQPEQDAPEPGHETGG